MRYTWDEKKNRDNIREHGIAFEDAKRIFEGPTVERTDDRFDHGETRVYAIGLVNGIEITVIYTPETMMKYALSPPGGLNLMKDAPTGKKSKAKRGTDWERLRHISDAEVHAAVAADPDAHPTDEAFWGDAEVVMPRRKEVITIRLDADLLAWFRQQPGYQTRINAILRTFMKAHAHKKDQHAPA